MIKYFCDRCKVETTLLHARSVTVTATNDVRITEMKRAFLCYECASLLYKWLKVGDQA